MRLIAVLMAAGFLGTGAVDAYGLHRCPHHDGLPGGGAPADQHAHGAAPQADTGADAHGEHGPCTCVGVCGLTGGVLPVGPAALSAVATENAAAQPIRPASDVQPLHFAYLLPFANAPPSMR